MAKFSHFLPYSFHQGALCSCCHPTGFTTAADHHRWLWSLSQCPCWVMVAGWVRIDLDLASCVIATQDSKRYYTCINSLWTSSVICFTGTTQIILEASLIQKKKEDKTKQKLKLKQHKKYIFRFLCVRVFVHIKPREKKKRFVSHTCAHMWTHFYRIALRAKPTFLHFFYVARKKKWKKIGPKKSGQKHYKKGIPTFRIAHFL